MTLQFVECSEQPILALAGVSFSYDGAAVAVLRDLTLSIPGASVTAILGPNGCGKSTLLHVMLGLLRPRQGDIVIAGRPLAAYSRRQLSRLLGLVPQDEHLSFEFSVLDYVLLGRAPHLRPLELPGVCDRQAALAVLQTVGLNDAVARSIASLSGGERQLATIARALAQQPRILLLDEPTSHLDLANRRRILQLLRSLARQGVTVIFTTHDPSAAATTADNVILMRQGQLLASGAAAAVLTSEHLSATYQVPVQVYEVQGTPIIHVA